MRTPSPKKLCSLSLTVLLFLPAVPALAEGTAGAAGGVELHLEEALALHEGPLRDATFRLDETIADEELEIHPEGSSDSEAMPETAVNLAPEASWRTLQEGTGSDSGAKPKKKGFGRWLKKHWYVPVLIAAAIGVAVGDDGSDENDEEADD